jgi:citrate synthase
LGILIKTLIEISFIFVFLLLLANREEARELAERHARYALIHEKIPEELKGYVELDYFSVLMLPYAESVKLNPPNAQNQASIGDKALIATSIIAALIPIAWTIYSWITRKR